MNQQEQNNHYRFGGNRYKVLERDGFKCLKCGMTAHQHKKKYRRLMTVDHIDGNKSNHVMDNLQTLCLPCHGAKDRKRLKPKANKTTFKNGNPWPFKNRKWKMVGGRKGRRVYIN